MTREHLIETKERITEGIYYLLITTRAGEDLESAAYEMRKDGEEFITLTFSNGNKKRICVTGDSGVAMAQDVLRHF